MKKILRRFLSHWTNWLGLGMVLFFIAVSLAAPLIDFPTRELTPTEKLIPQPPSADAWLGTTVTGTDIFSSLFWGARSALSFGLKAAFLSAAIGSLVGLVGGYAGGAWGKLLLRVTDGFLTVPLVAGYLILHQAKAVVFESLVGSWDDIISSGGTVQIPPRAVAILSIDALSLAIILFSWMPYARMIYASVAVEKSSQYIEAAVCIGAKRPRILFRHLLPNTISPAVVLLARDVSALVILQATLAFAGFGGSSGWGSLLLQGRTWIIGPGGDLLLYWWVWLPATLCLILFGIGWNLVGDGLNDALNPRAV